MKTPALLLFIALCSAATFICAADKPLVGELQEDCVTNVRKRDAYHEKVEHAKAAETSVMTLG